MVLSCGEYGGNFIMLKFAKPGSIDSICQLTPSIFPQQALVIILCRIALNDLYNERALSASVCGV
tara:strand:- start:38919 stop:39113 length:195 start_codon:yes stop_codon:yes gene_type:complete